MFREIWNQIITMQPGIGEISLRLACAMLVGLVIGTEREYTHRPAGMRTHILVALGACVVSITGELLFHQYHSFAGAMPDPARLSAQVITGVGFLGAGTILREGFTVKGLTTAASVWATACLGIASGFGYYGVAVLGMAFIFVTLTFFEWLQKSVMRPSRFSIPNEYILETTDISASLDIISGHTQTDRTVVSNVLSETTEYGHRVTFQMHFHGRHSKKHQQNFFSELASAPSTRSLLRAGEKAESKV